LGEACEKSGRSGGYVWRGIEPKQILEFLQNYVSHEDAYRARTDLIARYIRKQNEQQELTEWTVLLVSNSKASATAYNIEDIGELGMVLRSAFLANSEDKSKYTIRRLVSPTDEARDLTKSEKEEAKRLTVARWERNDSKKKSKEEPKRPGGFEIRNVRPKEKGLLCIYPLDPAKANLDCKYPIMGISLSFPASDTAQEITYLVNRTYKDQEDWYDC
jgi:hypothetical protein